MLDDDLIDCKKAAIDAANCELDRLELALLREVVAGDKARHDSAGVLKL